MNSLSRAVRAAALAALGAATLIPSASAAETVGADGWICTTDAPPALPSSGADRARVLSLRPAVTFDAAGHMTMRFGAPVASGATIERTGGSLPTRTSRSGCTSIGFVDQQTTDGKRYRFEVDAAQRTKAVLTVGNKLPAVHDRGRVVLVVDEAEAENLTWALDTYYVSQLQATGWRVVKEVVSASDSPASIRARLRQRVAEDSSTKAAVLIGAIPVAQSGNDGGAGARPTDVYYADVDGTWTDATVNTPAPADPERRNVPGDGRFDQEAPPSALELAVGRIDTSALSGVERNEASVSPSDELWMGVMRAAEARWLDYGDIRDESFVIDQGDPASVVGQGGWMMASAVGGASRAGSRADLDAAAQHPEGYSTRPKLLFQHGRGTASTLSNWTGATAGDIASTSNVGRAPFVVSAGGDTKLWHRNDSLARAMLAGGMADVSSATAFDADGLALGDPVGVSLNAGLQDAERGVDRLASVMGDPTLPLKPTGYTEVPTAKIAAGCTDVSVSFSVQGVPSTAVVTADLYRSVNGGAFELVLNDARVPWSASTRAHVATLTDVGVATAQSGKDVVYEVRPTALHTTGRGSFFVDSTVERSEALRMFCRWSCEAPTGAMPTSEPELSRSRQLESTVTFGDGGRSASIRLDRRHAGRTVTGQRKDAFDRPSTEACPSGTVASGFTTDGLTPGKISEFELSTSDFGLRIPVLAGHQLPGRFDRGRIIVVTERTVAADAVVRPALAEYLEALETDGYEPVQLAVDRTESVASVRSRLKAVYDAEPQRTKTAVLIGHVPVPYSGTGVYDGHPEHNGAWSTDAPYADLNGAWTDSTVNITNSSRAQNRNVPGDGKFDQNRLPSQAELAIGRIDFFDMSALGSSEAQLTANYLRRSIQYRTGQLTFKNAAFTRDNFGFVPAGYLFNVSPVVGSANVRAARSAADAKVDAQTGGPYLLAYTAGSGWYTSSGGIGTTTDQAPALFMGSLGSYYGDWDSTNNFLRGHLGKHLGALWENWSVDGLALGESVGETVQRSMNRNRTDLRNPLNSYLGDPTLRAYPIKGVRDLNAWDEWGCQYSSLSWTASADPSVTGYTVERKYGDGWRLLTSTPLPRTTTSYEDHLPRGFYSGSYYRVRPVRQESTSRGSFMNVGQGTLAYAGSCD